MSGTRIRVLLVDDDEDDYIITRDLLSDIEGRAYDLEWVGTFDAALAEIILQQHDVYLLDYRLGQRTGLDLLREAIRVGCKAPFILLTGQGDQEIDVEAMKAGAADYLVKGQIGPTILERSIRYSIEHARLVAGLEAEVAARTAEIRREKETSETILRSVGDAILMSDLKMQIRFVNPAFVTMTGYTAAEVIGRKIDFLFQDPLSGHDEQGLRRALRNNGVWCGEVTTLRKDGRTYEAALTVAPVFDADGQLVGFVSSHRDISVLKELEQARTQFITSISHQLRTPATNLKLYTRLLHCDRHRHKLEQYLAILDEQTDRLCDLIQDVVEMTALDTGDAAAACESVHPYVVLGAVMARHDSQARRAGVTLTARAVPPDLLPVRGDPARLTQALDELVENALMFTPSGGEVVIEVKTAHEKQQDWVTLAVTDTGPGIAPDEQARIFDRFYRGRLAEAGQLPGTGLGLSKVQEIMRAHGGRVTVESQLGAGSTFTLWLPGLA